MKLYYYRDRHGNFGDDLNPWLWSRLLPAGTLDDDSTELFLGIGTIIGRHVPARPRKWVMGSGTGYGAQPTIDETWNFCCVRGPLTAKALGLDASLIATDPGILVTRTGAQRAPGGGGVAFMPHHSTAAQFQWQSLCDGVGITLIDPRGSVDATLLSLAGTGKLITEALHGAVVADALRIPWIRIVGSGHVLEFKWQDWAASLGVDCTPRRHLESLWDVERGLTPRRRAANRIKRLLRGMGIQRRRWMRTPAASTSQAGIDLVGRHLKELATNEPGVLSDELALAAATRKLIDAIDRFVTRKKPQDR